MKLSIDQIVASAKNDAITRLNNAQCTDEIYVAISAYSNWADDKVEAENAILRMFRKEFSNLLK